jgi:phthalate 4,5-dioxygenase oxygenase subunit
MLSHEDNELLCRVGPGTLMGDLFRQYWLPAMQSEELPEPDCDQVRVLLLGEELIGFRDSNGNIGLVENSCPHRGASLYYARNEDCGLRCIYHGWKFDVNGNCLDMPNEPAQSNFKDRVKAVAYPTVERGGIIWTYMGPRSTPPPLPDLEGNMADNSMTYSQIRNCNWMQALEGDIDTVHFSWLHVGHIKPEDAVGDFMRYQVTDRSPTYSVLDTDWGTSYATFTSANEEEYHCRMASFLMPCYTMVPQGIVMANRTVRAWVPMDDDHVIWFIMAAPPLVPDDVNELREGVYFAGGELRIREALAPRSTDWFGRFRPIPDAGNDYLVKRDDWREGKSFTGLPSVSMEDHAVTESMGTIYNRSREHLGTSDAMIIRTRHRLIAAAEAFAKEGIIPPGVDEPEVYRQRSGALLLNKDRSNDWFEATKDQRAAFVYHPTEEIYASYVRD